MAPRTRPSSTSSPFPSAASPSPPLAPQPGFWGSRRSFGWSGLALGAASTGVGLWTTLKARDIRAGVTPELPQQEAAARNGRIRRLNTASGLLYGLGGAAALGGTLLLLWPEADTLPLASVGPDGAALGVSGAF